MKRLVLGVGAVVALGGIAGLSACGVGTDCDFGLCAGSPADADADGGLDGEVPDATKPPDCDDTADPTSEAAKGCVVDSFALFVDGDAGDDANNGSKEKPFKKIATAIGQVGSTGKRRIYICGSGTYAEHLKLTTAASLHGGFACSTWAPDNTAKPKVAPTDPGYALHIDNVAAAVTVSDLELVAPDVGALKDGTSSIAVFANTSNVSFLRAALRAQNGAEGAPGEAGKPGEVTSPGGLDGNPASGGTGAPSKTCTCSSSTTATKGGAGGTETGGGPGEPNYGGAAPNNGSPGAFGGGSCGADSLGKNGADAPAADDAAPTGALGDLSDNGWRPAKGADATENGKPGQGGGGGGARSNTTGGSGGGCGGCGGFAGKGSGGGGASIAVLVYESTVALAASTLEAKSAGAGGTAGAGGEGSAGGEGGSVGACPGGNGGRGADGGAGAGGAGGVATGILFKGAEPTVDAETTIAQGEAGAGGKGGTSPTNDGPIGVAGKTLDASKL